MSVDVMETTEGIASSAMSAKEGSARVAARAGADVSRCASDFGVRSTEPATTIPKMTAAAIRTEKDSARLVDFCIRITCSLLEPGPGPGQSEETRHQAVEFRLDTASRLYSTAMQRSMATGIPAASSRAAEAGSTTPCCMKKKETPRAIAWAATGATSEDRRKTSTMSMDTSLGISARLG